MLSLAASDRRPGRRPPRYDSARGPGIGMHTSAATKHALSPPCRMSAFVVRPFSTPTMGFFQASKKLPRGLCHGNGSCGSGVKMAHDHLVRPPPVPACDHPAGRLALCPLHAQLSRRRRSARRARSGCLVRDGAAMGFKVRAVDRSRTSPSTAAAHIGMASRRGCAAKASAVMWWPSCMEDEGRPLEADRQG